MNKRNLYIIVTLLLIAFLTNITGCNIDPNVEEKEPNQESKLPETPEALLETEDMIRELIYDIDAIPGIEIAIEEKEKTKEEISEESDIDMGVDEKQETAERDVNLDRYILENSILIHSLFAEEIEGHAAKMEVLPANIDEIWYEIDKRMSEVHNKWNLIEGELKKVKIDERVIQEYESIFDECTLSIKARERVRSLNLLNELTLMLGEFRGHFDHKVPSEVVKMTAHNRKIILLAYEDNYEEALIQTEKLKELLNTVRNRLLEREAEDVIQKLELSIEDLENELTKKDFYLSQLKAAIVIKNTKLVSEAFESIIKK